MTDNTELVHYAESKLGPSVCRHYWDASTDHADFGAILSAIDTGGGQSCDIPGVLRALDQAGFKVVRK